MGDALLIVILLAAFGLAIGLVQVLSRLTGSAGGDGWADEPPDTGRAAAAVDRDVTGPGGPR